jgi:Domain of unknown function (DUF4185)
MTRSARPLLMLLVVLTLVGIPAHAQEDAVNEHTRLIAQLTGERSMNKTGTNFGVDGTDLGHTFLYDGKIYMVFGDTFGVVKSDWRSNVAAVISDDDPSDGLTFDRMIEDAPGHAKELLASKKLDGDEITVIPTYGIAVGDRMYLHYMSVNRWGEPGHWDLNSSGLAYSDDRGETWTKDPAAVWPGDSNFGQVAITQVENYVYFFGIPGGRYGGVKLARIDQDQLLEVDSYEYWDGTAWKRGDDEAGKLILPAPVGELSVRWNSNYQKWIMTYLNETTFGAVLRTADCLTGPWTDEEIIASSDIYPQLYAPYLLPRWNDGPEIYFTMSQFGPYNVYLLETKLDNVAPSTQAPECVEGT